MTKPSRYAGLIQARKMTPGEIRALRTAVLARMKFEGGPS